MFTITRVFVQTLHHKCKIKATNQSLKDQLMKDNQNQSIFFLTFNDEKKKDTDEMKLHGSSTMDKQFRTSQ